MKAKVVGFLIGIAVVVGAAMLIKGGTYVGQGEVGVYKANTGEIFKVKPICTHLGCELYFNNIDKTWECPCHGSKFSYDGKSIEVPSNKNLE